MKKYYYEYYVCESEEGNKKANGKYIKVDSSVIAAVKYENGLLSIKLVSGEVYVYSGVSADTVLELLSAESAGRYFAKNIKDNYKCIRI